MQGKKQLQRNNRQENCFHSWQTKTRYAFNIG